jgi:hypothetical protein
MERENARLGPSVQPDAAHGGADPLGAFWLQMERQAGPVGQ